MVSDQTMTVTDEDREAADALRGALEFGQFHFNEAVMFYRRDIERKAAQAERDAVVKWLRDNHNGRLQSSVYLADCIEAGEHSTPPSA